MNQAAKQVAPGSREQRRHDRYPVSLPATLTAGKKVTPTQTSDVSFGGLFVLTDDPPALRNLVRINLELPNDGQPIQLLGMAVFVVRPNDKSGRPAGAGVQFFGIDQDTRERWERFITTVRLRRGGSVAGRTAVRPHIDEKVPRPELRLNAPSVGALHAALFASREGSMSIPSPLSLATGSTLDLVLVHPDSGRCQTLPALVEGADGKRLRVRIVDRDARSEQILRFLSDDFHVTVDLEVSEDVDLGDLG